jgi:hypothetical protein
MQCPHCLVHFHEQWTYQFIVKDRESFWGIASTICAACNRAVLTRGTMYALKDGRGLEHHEPVPGAFTTLVYPKGVSRVALPAEIPEEFAADYKEACLVFADSEKASAALSRRCLQHVLREKGNVRRGDLANEIQQVLDSKQLPLHIAEDLDAIRHIGNFAAHTLKSTNSGEIVDVEPQEAEWLLNILEQLFDFYFVQPARAQARRDALNAKLKTIGKPAMKQPS